MLRILHVISGDLWAGAEVQAYTLIRKLKEMPDTEVAAVLMNPGELADRLRALEVTVFLADERRLGFIPILMRLLGILWSWRPDVIHTHRQKENILGSLANWASRRVPSLRTVHGASEHLPRGWRTVRRGALVALDQWCGRALQDRIIAVSRALGTRLSADFPAAKIVVIENGIDAEAVLAERSTADFRLSSPQAVHVGIVGRLVEVKRIDLFLEAATRLVTDSPGTRWQFHIFGGGPLDGPLRERSVQLGLAQYVIFHGHRTDIASCIASLDAMVICSDHEGMPMAALEASVLGIPIVAHAVGGLPDIVPREFLVTEHNAVGYGEGVRRALSSDGKGIAARAAAVTLVRYSARANAERTKAVYELLVAESSAG